MYTSSSRFFRRSAPLLLATLGLLQFGVSAEARGKTKINYVPGVTLVPDVYQSDGQTPRAYDYPPQAVTFWKEGLPIQQGDKIRLNVFVATGGADLKEIKIKLDNTQIADIAASPWNSVIDTTTLGAGSHMIEVWAEASGDPPQSSTKQLSFYVVKELPAPAASAAATPTTKVKGYRIALINGQQVYIPLDGASGETTDPTSVQPLPAFLAGKPVNQEATVALRFRDASLPAGSPTSSVPFGPMVIQQPTVFAVVPATGSGARQYAFALERDGQTILTSDKPFSLSNPRQVYLVKIQGETADQPGLHSGTVRLWVWGIDAEGRPGVPSQVDVVIP